MSSKKFGKIWETADTIEEARSWCAQYLARGAIEVSLKPQVPRPTRAGSPTTLKPQVPRPTRAGSPTTADTLVDFVVTIPRTDPGEINPVLNRSIDLDEWMTEDEMLPLGENVFVRYDTDTIRLGVVVGRRLNESYEDISSMSPVGSAVSETVKYLILYNSMDSIPQWTGASNVCTDVEDILRDMRPPKRLPT